MSERKVDMWNDCYDRARADERLRDAVAAQNEAMRTIRELMAQIATLDARIAGRMRAAGKADAAVVVGTAGVITLGPRGEVQYRQAYGPLAGIFGDDDADEPEEVAFPAVAEAVADSPDADDDIREAAAHFDPASLADIDEEDLREGIFQAAIDDELGPGGREFLSDILGKPATASEFAAALESGLIPEPAVA